MTPSKAVGDLQRSGIKFGHELNHLDCLYSNHPFSGVNSLASFQGEYLALPSAQISAKIHLQIDVATRQVTW